MKGLADSLIFTCEHGGHAVPGELQPRFQRHGALLRSHRGWDPGALVMARYLARHFTVPLHSARVSRLVVDLNRSPWHRNLFSRISLGCSEAEREYILNRYYTSYRQAVEQDITQRIKSRVPQLHVSVHSFTPRLDGQLRNADIGILYDPARDRESRLAQRLRRALCQTNPALRVRCNYPYRGTADGFTTWLRRRYPRTLYAGIELELNQAIVAKPAPQWAWLRKDMAEALRGALDQD